MRTPPGTGRDRLCDFRNFVEASVKPLVSSERTVHLILFGILPNLGAVYSVYSLECESAERGRPHTGWESLQHSGKMHMGKNKISLRF